MLAHVQHHLHIVTSPLACLHPADLVVVHSDAIIWFWTSRPSAGESRTLSWCVQVSVPQCQAEMVHQLQCSLWTQHSAVPERVDSAAL